MTAWLTNWRAGDQDAGARLFGVIYPELRRMAARFVHKERLHHTLESDALANEARIRLLGSEPIARHEPAHFFAIAAQTMRRVLIDYARAHLVEKRGGEQQRASLSALLEFWRRQ
jgi:RNA polymerase sigma-70 factor, ECF subfamily